MLENERIPRKARQLSRFMCQELLYEYMIQSLDEERYRAVEQFLGYASDLQNELKIMHTADNYCAHLSQTRISAAHLEELKNVKSMTAIITDRFRWVNWPDAFKWATQAFAVSFVLAMVALVIPWSSLDFKMPKMSPRKTQPAAKTTTTMAPVANVVYGPPKPADLKPEIEAKAPEKPPEKNPVTMVVQNSRDEKKTVQLQGLLYRLMMTIDNAEKRTPDIKEKIEKLGGEKAGQVDLGWRKTNPDGSYFHFKMPESNYNELIKTLGGYGPVRIYKSPHERIMPPGEIRIILFIEDKKP
jgi:hypothetical protein